MDTFPNKKKRRYLPFSCSDKDCKVDVVNRRSHFKNGESLEITPIVPLT